MSKFNINNSKKNIVLIGMPGCGKSTIGKILSTKLGLNFCDLDAYIEKSQNKTISEIFANGECYFRDIEQKAVEEVSKKNNLIIATGGGVILRKNNINKLKEKGIIIFIDRDIENIISDINISKRPLLKEGKQKLYKLYKERYELYKKYCNLRINNCGTVEDAVNKIIQLSHMKNSRCGK